MGLYNFQHRFVPFILDGRKQHTIRAIRKHPDRPGNICHCYEGLRHPGAILLGRWPCVNVEPISITHFGRIIIGDYMLDPSERESLARADGFADFGDMIAFWNGRLPFRGHLIHWRFTPPAQHKSRAGGACRSIIPG